MRPKNFDYTGEKFNKLTVLSFDKIKNGKRMYWLCQCDCGKITSVHQGNLVTDKVKSCGCLSKQINKNHFNWKGFGEINKWFFTRIKQNSVLRNFEFNITIEYVWDLFLKQNRKCALSGIEIEFNKTYKELATASLDRINSNKGYIPGNVQWVHKDINKMKQNLDESLFINLCKKVAENKK